MTDISMKLMRVAGSDVSQELPSYESKGAAGMDLRANFKDDLRATGICVLAGTRVLVPTGLALAIPVGYEAQIRPRSGLALKHGISLVNSPGTIDSDYRGEIGVILINHGTDDFQINHGDRIAQILFAPVTRGVFEEVETLEGTVRGAGGFGSTGRS